MWRQAARQVKKTPSRLTAITRRHVSSVISANEGEPSPMPALANTASTRPISATAAAKPSITAASVGDVHRAGDGAALARFQLG